MMEHGKAYYFEIELCSMDVLTCSQMITWGKELHQMLYML